MRFPDRGLLFRSGMDMLSQEIPLAYRRLQAFP